MRHDGVRVDVPTLDFDDDDDAVARMGRKARDEEQQFARAAVCVQASVRGHLSRVRPQKAERVVLGSLSQNRVVGDDWELDDDALLSPPCHGKRKEEYLMAVSQCI